MDRDRVGDSLPSLLRASSARAVLAGGGVITGALVAPALAVIWLPGLCLLAALGWSLRRAWSQALAWVAVGIAFAAAAWVAPMREPAVLDPARPVDLVVERRGAWRDRGDSFQVRGTAQTIRQRARVDLRPLEIIVFWPAETPPPDERRLRLRGYLKPAAHFFNEVAEPPARVWFFALESARLAEVVPDGESTVSRALRACLRRARGALDAALPPASRGGSPGESLAGALLLGDAGRLSPEVSSTMRRHGLAHLTAASGLHVGIVAGCVALLWGGSRRSSRTLAPALAVLVFVALLDLRPPLARAAACLWCLLACRALSRLPAPTSLLGASAAVLVLCDPRVADDLGFQLSYAATAGILVLRVPLARSMRPLPRLLRESLGVSLAAQLATTPLIVARFAVVPVAAPLWNLFFVPWTAVLLVVGAAVGLVETLAPAGEAARCLDVLAWPFGWLEHVPPTSAMVLPVHGSVAAATLTTGLVAALWLGRRRRAALPLGAAACVVVAVITGGGSPAGDFAAVFLDVGQGDALLLRDGRRTLLVDGGGLPRSDVATRVLLPALARLGVRRVDVALVTHGDRDHCAGLLELARWIPIRELWVGPTLGEAPCGNSLLAEHGDRATVLFSGWRREVGGFLVEVLHAPAVARSANDGSVVVTVTAGGRRLLLTGDIEASAERALLAGDARLDADLLKVAHHGSRTSSTAEFLAAVRPRLAVVQAGRHNVYGHPARDVVERLGVARALLLRTDLDGRVAVSWRAGGPLRIATARDRLAPFDGAPRSYAGAR